MFLFSIDRGGRLLLNEEERVVLFSIYRRQTPSLCRGKSVSLLDIERADSFSMKRRFFMKRRECFSLLYIEEADSFSMQRRDCLSSRSRESRLLLYEEERVFLFSI